jgi:prepilin-type N-terminal cleavage/methylation domain
MRGFTLVEVIVAITVGAMVILAARLLVEQLGDSAQATIRAATRIDAEANAEHVMRGLATRSRPGTTDATPFEGDATHARFSSWCDVPGGWQERCLATLTVPAPTQSDSAGALLLTPGSGDAMPIRSGVKTGMLAYLTSASDGGQWVAAWNTASLAPLAIVAVLDLGERRDTLIFRIGARR